MQIETSELSKLSYLKFVHQLHGIMQEKDIILVYEGEVDQSITKSFTNLIERNLAGSEESLLIKKRVYHVMVECLQNICKHSDNLLTGESLSPGEGVFVVARDKESYIIVTGNSIYQDRVKGLTNSIDMINELSQEELKIYYKEQLKGSRLSEKGGAGLGLIDIARKTGRRIEYLIEPITDQVSFLILKLTIPQSESI